MFPSPLLVTIKFILPHNEAGKRYIRQPIPSFPTARMLVNNIIMDAYCQNKPDANNASLV